MDWGDYIKKTLDKSNGLDDLQIALAKGKNEYFGIPPIIKMSIELIHRLSEAKEQRIVIVFPEKTESIFLLLILKVIHDIFEGRAEKEYNPYEFVKGQKLKCGNCVVEFDRIDEYRGKTMLHVKNANCLHGIPLELAPFFQLTDTNRPLSSDAEFEKTKNEIRYRTTKMTYAEHLIAMLIDYKTHLNDTVFSVAPIGRTKDMISDIRINGLEIKDLLLMGQVDADGNIETINPGQLSGDPAIVLSTDIYSVFEAIKRGSKVKSLFIDGSNPNVVTSELDVLDDLLQYDFPVIFLLDTVNSFELEVLETRGFCIWRWDEESIHSNMYGISEISINKKVRNCGEQEIEYLKCEDNEIGNSLAILYRYRKEVDDMNVNMTVVFEKLFSLTFLSLRNILPLTHEEYLKIDGDIMDCESKLNNEKRFVSVEMFNDFKKVIKSQRNVFSKGFAMPKIIKLKEILYSNQYKNICIIIEDRADKEKHQTYFDEICTKDKLNMRVSVLRQSEYTNNNEFDYDVTIVSGWLGSTAMKQIIYSYNTTRYFVLLYSYEEKWKNHHVKSWKRVLKKENKKNIIEKALKEISINTSVFIHENITIPATQNELDEFKEIEMVLQANRYRKYLSKSGNRSIEEDINAIPVNFIGGYFAFYKLTHKLVSVTEIVLEQKDNIKTILPSELNIGDFIVVRESQRDLVKEFADIILFNSGKSELREFAAKWREALQLESIFSSFDEICLKLKKAGCTKNQFTIKQWMKNEDIISPQSIEDLRYIAEATEDSVLLEKFEDIFNAGMEVKRAHIQAGKTLSELLKQKIAQKIQELGGIDPYNIWEPITLYLDDIGSVKILKVIDIGNAMRIDSTSINYLISEY